MRKVRLFPYEQICFGNVAKVKNCTIMKATTSTAIASTSTVSTNANNVDSQSVSVLTTVQFMSFVEAYPLSNVVLRDRKRDRYIVLKRVQLYAAKAIPTVDECKNAWRATFFNTWLMKFTIDEYANKDLKCGNLFRNLDRFDVQMYLAGKKVFDTADDNLDLVEGKVGLTPKSKTREDFVTLKALKAHCYKIADSAWMMRSIDIHVSKRLAELAKEEATGKQAGKQTGKENGKNKKVKSVQVSVSEVPNVAEKSTTQLEEAA